MDFEKLTERIIKCAYQVHNTLGSGFLEKVYENALGVELKREGLAVVQQESINVYYHDELVGEFYADLIVDGRVIVELKAVQKLAKEHEVQLVNYLNATGINDGLLLNFGASVDVKRKYKNYRERKRVVDDD